MTQVNTENQTPKTDGDNTPENEVEISEDIINSLPDDVANTIRSLTEQKKHYREKFEKESSAKVELENKLKSFTEVEKPKAEKKEKFNEDEWREKMEFAVTHRDLNQEDLDTAFRLSKAYDLKPKDILEHEMFKAYQKVKEEKASSANTTPTPGSDSPVLSNFSNFEKVQPSDIKNMDSATFGKYEKWLQQKNRK